MTVEELKQKIDTKYVFVPVRNCSICGEPVGYVLNNGAVSFNSDCGCTVFGSELQPRTLEAFVDYYENSTDSWKAEINKMIG